MYVLLEFWQDGRRRCPIVVALFTHPIPNNTVQWDLFFILSIVHIGVLCVWPSHTFWNLVYIVHIFPYIFAHQPGSHRREGNTGVIACDTKSKRTRRRGAIDCVCEIPVILFLSVECTPVRTSPTRKCDKTPISRAEMECIPFVVIIISCASALLPVLTAWCACTIKTLM